MGHGRTRIDRLARRVGWLDPRRRVTSILLAAAAAPLMSTELHEQLGADWPFSHAVAMTVMAGGLMWIGIEIALAGIVALWETELARLLGEAALPRARVLARRRRGRAARR